MLEIWDFSFPFRLSFPNLIPDYTAIADTAQNQMWVSCKSWQCEEFIRQEGQNQDIHNSLLTHPHTAKLELIWKRTEDKLWRQWTALIRE